MTDLSKIKSEKIKKLIRESYRFSLIPENLQEELVDKISKLPLDKQELGYKKYFENKNIEERNIASKKINAFKSMLAKIKEADNYIKSMAIKNTEEKQEAKEKSEEEELLSKLTQI